MYGRQTSLWSATLVGVTLWEELAPPWRICFDEAWKTYRAGSLPIGAAVVDATGTLAGRGRNRIFETLAEQPAAAGRLFGHRLAHAEMNAFLSIDHEAVDVRQCVLYTLLEPCALCVGAIRMLALRDVRYAARDSAAGSLELFEATDFMRRGNVRVQHLQQPVVEAVVIALNTAALLSMAHRFDVRPPIARWEGAGLPGVKLGRDFFASGELSRLATSGTTTAEKIVEQLGKGIEAAGTSSSNAPSALGST